MSRILVIEDNHDIRENLEEILELANYDVITAANGMIGINRAKSEGPDLILCDIAMPEKNGYEVLETLKDHPVHSNTPFIFLTASAQEKDIAMGRASRADHYFTKPFNTDELLKTIEELLLNRETG